MPVSKVAIVRHLITYPLRQHVGRNGQADLLGGLQVETILSSLRELALPFFPY